MPLYEYECTACGNVIQATQRMSDPPLTDCECGRKGTLKRLLSAGTGVIFKGNGFYATDYKGGSKSSGSAASSESASSAASESPKPAEPPRSGGGCGGGCSCHS